MISQLEILRFLKTRKLFNKYFKYIHERNFPTKQGYLLLVAFGDFFKTFKENKEIEIEVFSEWFFHIKYPDLPQEQREEFRKAISSLNQPTSKEFSEDLIKQFNKQCLGDKVLELASTGNLTEIKKELEDADKNQFDLISNTRVKGDFEHVIQTSSVTTGIKWNLKCLTDNLPCLAKGIFLVIAARPGVGKSSFLAQTVSNAISQVDSPILWLNNENIGERACYLRLYESYFGESSEELLSHKEEVIEKIHNDKILEKVICHDVQGMGRQQVVSLIEHYKPSLLIIDMLDYLSGFEAKSNETSDIKYLNLYQWALDLSCKYCPVIGTSQLSYEAEGWVKGTYIEELSMWPLEAHMMGSKTAKQGKAGVVLMIGRNYTYPDRRYFSAPRNKYGNQGGLKHTLTLDGERSRFIERIKK